MSEPIPTGRTDDDGRPIVTLPCPECGQDVEGAERGKGSVLMRLGQHRRIKHGVKGTSATTMRRRKDAPTEEQYAAHPVRSAVEEVVGSIGPGTSPPSATQLGDAMGRGVGLLSSTVATIAVETDRGIRPEERDTYIDYLSMSDEAARALMRPVGRLLAPSRFNRTYGRAVVENVDLVGALGEAGVLIMHWREYLTIRAEHNALMRAQLDLQAQRGLADVIPHPSATPTAQSNGVRHTAPVAGYVAGSQATEAMTGTIVTAPSNGVIT